MARAFEKRRGRRASSRDVRTQVNARQPIRLVNQPRVARNFDTILLNRPNDLHGIITHKTGSDPRYFRRLLRERIIERELTDRH